MEKSSKKDGKSKGENRPGKPHRGRQEKTGKPEKTGKQYMGGGQDKRGRQDQAGRQNKTGRQDQAGGGSVAGDMRLNRYIANTGICSRREADELIRSGHVQVNGRTVTELGTRVGPGDSVSYRGKQLRGEKKVYVLLNKPKDTVTTVKDTHDRKTVMDLVRGCCTERIYPVVRLDRNTTGVLLLTNDGELAEVLSHPSFNKKKIYHIYLDRAISSSDMEKLSEGFDLDDGFIQPDRVEYVEKNDRKQIGMEIHSGRNRIVRRMFEHLGYKVTRLDRVYYAGLTKKGLSRGRWRHLSPREIGMLKMSIPKKKPASQKPGTKKKAVPNKKSGKQPENP